jgi:ribosomal protein L11 methyltransferase
MGNYYELVFTIVSAEDYLADLLMNDLAEVGFDSFDKNELGFRAYVSSALFDEQKVQEVLELYKGQYTFSYEINLIPYKNWNEVWESSFQPINIADKVYVYADFHEKKDLPYAIKIQPKMAFGTGHHETTFQMAEVMLGLDFKGKHVLDMGCGTGILAILAHLMGASKITAIDIEEIAVESTKENAELNGMQNAEILCGDASLLKGQKYDIILANINRNILLNDMAAYSASLIEEGLIFFSGFYTEDLGMIQEAAIKQGMAMISYQSKNNWVVATFIKNK